jgi:hypothetical protein
MRKSYSKLAVFLSLGALVLAGVAALAPRRSSAASLSTAIIGMFPKDVGEFAYADLKAARQFAWFSQLRDQALPSRFRQFEQFLASAGVDPNTQVEELAWGFIPGTDKQSEQIVGVALGQFNPPATEQKFKSQKISFITDRGFHLYSFGGGDGDLLFFFIDANTAAFGGRQALDKLLDVRTGTADSVMHNDLLGPLITDANGTGQFWAAMDRHYTQVTLKQLLPQTDQFPQAAQVVDRVRAMFLNIQAGSGVDTTFQAVCATPDDANVLAAALQAGVLFRKYQATQAADTVMANALDSVRVTAAGDRLKVGAPITQDQLTSLLRNGTFATKM